MHLDEAHPAYLGINAVIVQRTMDNLARRYEETNEPVPGVQFSQ